MINDSFINCGGTIMSFEFCPVGNNKYSCYKCSQYLAVSTDYQKKFHIIGHLNKDINIIQIWKLSSLKKKKNT